MAYLHLILAHSKDHRCESCTFLLRLSHNEHLHSDVVINIDVPDRFSTSRSAPAVELLLFNLLTSSSMTAGDEVKARINLLFDKLRSSFILNRGISCHEKSDRYIREQQLIGISIFEALTYHYIYLLTIHHLLCHTVREWDYIGADGWTEG